jgi:hypothetical protein
MGPGEYPPTNTEEVLAANRRADGPKVAIVSSAEIAEQDTLNADYWVNRQPGESYVDFKLRRKIEDIERRARQHEAAAVVLRDQAAHLREGT